MRLDRYLAGLPAGLDSHPEALAKGSLVRNALEDQLVPDLLARLPPKLRRLASEPPMAGEWVPEVHFVALYLAITDARAMAETEVYAWARQRNQALFQSSPYRILMQVSSPGMLVRSATQRWANWHRGSQLSVEGVADDGVRILLRFPDDLFDPVMIRVFGQAFLAALDTARVPSPDVSVLSEGRGFARFLARW